MHLYQESRDTHTIIGYTDTLIQLAEHSFTESVLIGTNAIHYPWAVQALSALSTETLAPVLSTPLEILLIGHGETGVLAPLPLQQWLAAKRIGFECMSIGAACRTFNVLLSEERQVAVGLLLPSA